MRRTKGFTLVELMVVLAILSLLASLSVPNYIDEINLKRANLAASETQATSMQRGLTESRMVLGLETQLALTLFRY